MHALVSRHPPLEVVMETLLLICLLMGAGLWGLAALMLVAVDMVRQQSAADAPNGRERREHARVPCHFRTLGDAPGSAPWTGDLSLGGACVRLPAAAPDKRLKVVAVDRNGVAAPATIEGRVVSLRREGALFAHHLFFDKGFDTLSVSALVAAATWAEPPEHEVL
jgi:PilZ domain